MELPGIVRDLGVAGREIVPDGPMDAVRESAVRTLNSNEPLTASQRDALAVLFVAVGELDMQTLNPAVGAAYLIVVEAFR